jgi:RNA 2',3'-cyclic 3'-phosphodiesterase
LTPTPAPRIRLFVALDLPAELRARLLAWGARALPQSPGVRLQRPEAMHVTLCFLGGQPMGEMDAIGDAMRLAVGARPALRLTPGAPIWLPRRRPRVAAVKLSDGTGQVAALQAALATALARGGWYAPEGRPFLAHVTVARVGRGGLSRPPELAPPPSQPATAAEVSLYRSHTAPAGARYEPLVTVRLADCAR